MKNLNRQSGFTAIELLITLFVAAAFLIAGYQLFNVVIKDGGQARAESRAANVAYDYMRRYAPSATDPCVNQTLVNNSSIDIDGLSDARITVAIVCPDYAVTSLSKIEVTMTFNTPQQTVKYATYANGVGSQVSDITEGLISWWKMNGNANSSVGTANGTVLGNTTVIQGQNGQENGAYQFNGTNSRIDLPLTSLPSPMTEITISLWARPTTVNDRALFNAATDDTANRLNVHMPYTTNAIYWDFGNISTTGRVFANSVFDNAWLNTWSMYTFTSSATGGQKVYRNGTQILFSATSSTFTKGTKTLTLAYYTPGNSYWSGSIDDMRIYSRALSVAEILTLYSAGAK